MAAGNYPLTIEISETFTFVFSWYGDAGVTPIDITGYSANMNIKARPGAPIIGAFSTGTGEIELSDPTNGEITIIIPDDITNEFVAGKYRYNINVTSPAGKITRLLEGVCTFSDKI